MYVHVGTGGKYEESYLQELCEALGYVKDVDQQAAQELVNMILDYFREVK